MLLNKKRVNSDVRKVFNNEGGKTPAHHQRGGVRLQIQLGRASEQPDLVEDDPEHGRGGEQGPLKILSNPNNSLDRLQGSEPSPSIIQASSPDVGGTHSQPQPCGHGKRHLFSLARAQFNTVLTYAPQLRRPPGILSDQSLLCIWALI